MLAAFLMLSASLADRFGRKRIFRIGLVTFVAGSALCAVAPSLGLAHRFPHAPGARRDDAQPCRYGHHRQCVSRQS
jgi:MFS family permease